MGVPCCQQENPKKNKLKEKKTGSSTIKLGKTETKDSKISKTNTDKKIKLNKKSEAETKIMLESLYKSYYAAKTYFNQNELKEKEVDAIHCCQKILEANKMLKEGKYKEINLAELPEKINSEYITGYSPEKRKEKIIEIIAKFKEDLSETRKALNFKMAEVKKILIKSKNKDMDKYRPYLDEEKNRLTEISKDIKAIEEIINDDYIPIPLVMSKPRACKKEKVNMDIEENQMQVKVSELTYTKSNPIVILVIKGDKLNMNKTIKGKSQDDINSTFTWNFSTDQFKDLIKYKIGIALGRTYSVKSTKPKGKGEFFLRKLKDNSSMKETVKLQMESGKEDKSINIEIKLRNPIIDKEYEDDFRDSIKLIKMYPKFIFEE